VLNLLGASTDDIIDDGYMNMFFLINQLYKGKIMNWNRRRLREELSVSVYRVIVEYVVFYLFFFSLLLLCIFLMMIMM